MYAAAAHHMDKGFLITGGIGNGYRRLASSEITVDGVTFEDFTPLPTHGLSHHCMVALNDEDDGDFFLAGGCCSNSKRVYIHKSGKWNDMARIPTARYGTKPSLEMGNELICLKALHCRPHVWPCQGKPRGKGGKDCGCRWVL